MLVQLPVQPEDVPWPTEHWERAPARAPAGIEPLAATLFDDEAVYGVTYALLVVHRGRLVYERYGAGANAGYLQYSWSMAKSVTHALVGLLVADGYDIHAPLGLPEWQADARATITTDHLLRMSSGLEFNEDYVDGEISDVIPMLFGEGRRDTGAFAAAKRLVAPVDTVWSYSSGTTNILCRHLRDVVGDGPSGMLRFMQERLFDPLGMRSPTPRFDAAGTFIGSSFLLCTPEDFARFGLLYQRDGLWDGRRILPPGWVDYARMDHARTPTHTGPNPDRLAQTDGEQGYGAHFWIAPQQTGSFYCSGYDGQRIQMLPLDDLVIVRCGRTRADLADAVWRQTDAIADLNWGSV